MISEIIRKIVREFESAELLMVQVACDRTAEAIFDDIENTAIFKKSRIIDDFELDKLKRKYLE